MATVRDALDRFLRAHEPYPAVVVDRYHNLVAANDALDLLLDGVAPELLEPPANGMRVALHPDGMAPRTLNLARVERAPAATRAPRGPDHRRSRSSTSLYDELVAYPGVEPGPAHGRIAAAVTSCSRSGSEPATAVELAFFSTLSTFGTAIDITLSELAIEAFYPANAQTAMRLLRGVDPD